jgi:3-oxoacyl-[acyl-carrier protein] reductase
MAGSLEGRSAIVTGGGRGIGRAFVLGLAGEGCRVAVADLNGDTAEATAGLARERGVEACAIRVDVSNRAQVDALVQQVHAQFGGVEILINDAGIYPRSPFLELAEEEWDRVLGTNLKGTFLCSQAAAGVMVDQGRGGRIVNMASRAAFDAHVRGTHYSASKAGIVALTQGMAKELAPHRITVNVIAPGVVNTAMPRQGISEEGLRELAGKIPLGRLAEPDDLVPTMLFLVGETGAYITGQTHHVNGGDLMR